MAVDSIEDRVSRLEEKLNALIKLFVSHMNDSNDSSKRIDNNFKLVESQITIVSSKIDKLSSKSTKRFDEVGNKLGEIKEELQKIEKVSNYPEEYQNLLKIVGK